MLKYLVSIILGFTDLPSYAYAVSLYLAEVFEGLNGRREFYPSN